MTATARDVERTGRDTTVAQWGVAAVVMVGSAASAGVGFAHLGEHWGIGVITGLGVDLALASGLIIGRRLRAVGVTTSWGTVLQWMCGAMTLALNSGAAALEGRWVLSVAHAFLPVLLVVLCEAGSQAQLKLHRLARQTAAAEQARRDAQLAQQRAAHEADLQRAQFERDAQAQRLERIRAGEVKAAELADAQHEREIADRHQAREQADRQLVASLASVLALGAALRRRPAPRPTRTPQPRTSRTPAPRTSPAPVRHAKPDVADLLPAGRKVADRLAGDGRPLSRSALLEGLRSDGVTCSTDRAGALLDRLRSEQAQTAASGPGRPLHAVGSGRDR